MKRIFASLMAILLTLSMAACTKPGITQPADDKLSIVCTIFPQYDWIRNIMGDKADQAQITLLLDSGVDLHNYQPTADDIVKISSCDMFIYVGGESDDWVADALKEATNKDMVVINLLEALGESVKEEEIVEGMQHEHDHEDEEHEHEEEATAAEAEEHEHEEAAAAEAEEHEHEDEAAAAEGEEHEHEYDEHVWLSLKNAKVIVSKLAGALSTLDVKNAQAYQINAKAYTTELNALDAAYEQVVEQATNKTLLFGDRFPFRYFVDDYGLSYFAAFAGCSAETEASFETIVFLSEKMDELQLKNIFVIDGSGEEIAKAIVGNTAGKDQKTLTLDSMQSVTAKDVEAGVTYLSVMQSNLGVLKAALS